MTHVLPPLPALRVFEAAGRHGSFAAAAAELGVTPSAVSHAVRALEDALGLPLFHRDPRGLRLTEAGQELRDEAGRCFESLSRCVQRLQAPQAERGLAGSVAPTFAARWLLPRLHALRRRHPDLVLTLTTERNRVPLGDGKHDFAIRMAVEPDGPGEWHKLVRERVAPVVAPGMAMPLQRALARLPVIHVTTVSAEWDAWSRVRGLPAPSSARCLRFDTVQMALDAAAEGLGIALARLPVCAGELENGRLRALDEPVEIGTAYWLVTRPGLLRQRPGRIFAAWLREELAGV